MSVQTIGIVYPQEYRHLFAITSVQLSFKESFPDASVRLLEVEDLERLGGLKNIDMLVLPPSHGDVTPYEYFMKGAAADNVALYAQTGAIAAFCSGAFAVIDRFSYRYPNGQTKDYAGYVPLIDVPAHGPEDFDFVVRNGTSRFSDVRLLNVFSKVSEVRETTSLCYANGPAFLMKGLPSRADVRVLAEYESGHSAILAKRVGKGVVVAFGALPEIQAAHMPENHLEWITDMRRTMEREEPNRRVIWDEAMSILAGRSLYPAFAPQRARNFIPS